ncbi:chromosome segregation protein SMC [Nanoarchaeota archaeon]
MTRIKKLVMEGFKSFAKRTELHFDTPFNVVLGSNGSGKCVVGETLVLLADGSQIRIEDLVNKKIGTNDVAKIDDGLIAGGDETEVLSLDVETLDVVKQPVKAFVKRKAPENLLKIQTKSGREIIATEYHPLFILNSEGNVESINAEDLSIGKRVAVPRRLPVEITSSFFVELLDLITHKDNLYVSWYPEFSSILKNLKTSTWKDLAQHIGVSVNTLNGILARQSVNFASIVKILRFAKLSDLEIIRLIPTVKSKNHHIYNKVPWKNSAKFARLLGYLLSEGRLTESNQIWFTNGTEEIVNDYAELMQDVFGLRVTINEYKSNCWDVLAYSCAAISILSKFGIGGGAEGKTIPNMFLTHSNEKELGELLDGLYSGDGYISKSSIELTTKSKSLACALESILTRLGLRYSSRNVIKCATNTNFTGVYRCVRLYSVSNFTKFQNFVTLTHPEKQKRLLKLLSVKSNPNVDLIGANRLVKEAAKDLGISIKPSTKSFPKLSAYCYNQCLPSRNGLQQLIPQLFTKDVSSEALLSLKRLATSNVFWDSIINIERIKPKDPWVYDLCVEKDHNFIANNFFVHNSNVVDSICFVLGKSSSKAMRAEKTANLIYNGGKTKKPAKQAEVSIIFDNKKKVFPIEEDELKISRIVKQEGNSKYKINGKTRTRTEVLELLNYARIDPNGYNIILQGDIIRLVEMSPIERRGIIEEIAGISIYEEKRTKAINELNKVEEKLGEAEIILKERETYLKELKKDRNVAQRYKDLNDRVKQNKATYVKLQIDKKEEKKKEFDDKNEKHATTLSKHQNKISTLRNKVSERKTEVKTISDDIESKGEVEQVALQKEIEQIKVDLATKKERIQTCENELVKIEKKKQQLVHNVKEIDKKIFEIDKEQGQIHNLKERKEKLVDELLGKIAKFKEKHKLDSDNDLQKEIDILDEETELLQKESGNIQERRQNLLREQDRLEYQIQGVNEKIKKVLEVEKEHKQEINVLKQKKKEFNKVVFELNDLLNQDSTDASELSKLRKDVYALREKKHGLEVKQAGIREAQSGNIAIKRVIDNKNKLGEIYGLVSELANVEDKYSKALEIAASQKINGVVVKDDKTASKCIKYLKENRLGIATFLPLNKVKGMPKRKNDEFNNVKGVHGFAVDLVKHDSRFKNIFSYVFGNTLVVDSIEVARRIGIGKVRMVTLDGDLTELSGAMRGGFHQKKTVGRFRSGELVKKLDECNEDITLKEIRLNGIEKRRKQSDDKITRLRELKATLEGEIIKSEKSLHLDSTDLMASQNYQKELEEKLKQVNKDLGEVKIDMSKITKKITDLKIKRQTLKGKIAELRNPTVIAELNAYEQKRKEVDEELVGLKHTIRNLELQKTDIHMRDKENSDRILKEIDKEKIQFDNDLKSLKQFVNNTEKDLKVKEKDQEKFYKQFKSLFEKRNKLSDEITFLENDTLKQEELARKEELTINSLSIELARVKAELAGLSAEFAQYEGIELVNKTEAVIKREINEFERMLANIGNVNLRALEIFDTVQKEYEKLLEKKKTLASEKEDVLKLMNEIEQTKTELFVEALAEVNKNFQEIFASLSTKGEAYLDLENRKEPFEGGLLIKVRLTGNKYLDIRSLSGGEKTLTALAFIFAIQENNPACFYLLDEVDAALDKQNSSLLGDLIKRYSDRAQYIIISHNDDLIQKADAMYGVTLLPEGGQSTVVSLKV